MSDGPICHQDHRAHILLLANLSGICFVERRLSIKILSLNGLACLEASWIAWNCSPFFLLLARATTKFQGCIHAVVDDLLFLFPFSFTSPLPQNSELVFRAFTRIVYFELIDFCFGRCQHHQPGHEAGKLNVIQRISSLFHSSKSKIKIFVSSRAFDARSTRLASPQLASWCF